LAAAARTGRPAVLVDASAEACRWARHNAAANGLADRVEVRHARFAEALRPGERFPLILADPPYVPSAEVARFPEDPVLAIDGGVDGLDLHRDLVAVIAGHLSAGGLALVQARGAPQAAAVAGMAAGHPGLRAGPVRSFGPDRAVIALRARPDARADAAGGQQAAVDHGRDVARSA
jgi:methylase of polypeptide subunit release factors